MLTLVEWSKLNPDPLQAGVVEVFARENPVLASLGFQNVAGSAYKFNREESLPSVAFRGFNEAYPESTGVVQAAIEALTLAGGDSDYDTAFIKMQTGDNASRAVHDAMKAKALSLTWLKTFFHGDSTANPKEFDGLENRLVGAQAIDGAAAALTLTMLDELCDSIRGEPSQLLMNKANRRRITTLARGTNNLVWEVDDFGRQIAVYAGVPIGIVEDDATGSPILDSTEIYAVKYGPDAVHGIQTEPMSVRDLGEQSAKPALRTRVEWFSSFVIKDGKAAARLHNIAA